MFLFVSSVIAILQTKYCNEDAVFDACGTCCLFYSERKLQATEYPHNLYIQNYSTATSTCLAVRKWLFSLSRELSLAADDQATTFIFWQAVDDVNRGHIRADDRLYQLKALQDASRKHEVTLYHTELSVTYLGSRITFAWNMQCEWERGEMRRELWAGKKLRGAADK